MVDEDSIPRIESLLRESRAKPLPQELGFSPDRPIREQVPKPLPHRKAIDDVVFDALGLTEEERRELYLAVAELVQMRLKKAQGEKG